MSEEIFYRPDGLYLVRPRSAPPQYFPSLWIINWTTRTASKVNIRKNFRAIVSDIDTDEYWQNVEIKLLQPIDLNNSWEPIK